MTTLNIDKREKSTNLDNLREKGLMPAVYYGKKEESTPISVTLSDFIKAWDEAGESSVVTLKGGNKEIEALICDVDTDPVTEIPRHADFYVFEKGHKIEVSVPIEFVGVSKAVKEMGGVLVKVLHELQVEALPKDLPQEIEVDISTLVDFESQIIAKDIELPEGVSLVEDPEEVVVLVSEAKEEEEEETPSDISDIEVEKKGKKEEEGEADENSAPTSEEK